MVSLGREMSNSLASVSYRSSSTVHAPRHCFKTAYQFPPCSSYSIKSRKRHMSRISSTVSTAAPSSYIKEKMEILREDLTHLFDDKGIDESLYDERVVFEDPITSYGSVKGYAFNIKMLRAVFGPTFELHDMKQTGEYEITTRWTMQMPLTVIQKTPLKKWWSPKLVFTGESIMGINPETGKFNRHSDIWDSISNQRYFSFEGFQNVLSQVCDLKRIPEGLETPQYQILKKTKLYEVRRYSPFLVAETSMPGVQSAPSVESGVSQGAVASPREGAGKAFNELARFIFGGNQRGEKLQMTTPVFSDTRGRMQFVIGAAFKDVSSVPEPAEGSPVECRQMAGGEYAVVAFSGMADAERSGSEAERLRAALCADGLTPDGGDWTLARYNDPSTPAAFRRNEILIPLKDFKLW